MSLLGHPQFVEAVELHKSGQFEEAGRLYQKLIEENPNDPDLWHFKGLLALHKGDADEAVRLISLAIVLKPGVPDYFQNLGLAYEAQGNPEKAAETYNKQANALQEQCRFADALPAYGRALELKPDFHSVLVNRGAAYDRLGRYDDAAIDFTAALVLVENLPAIDEILNTANALSGLGRAEEAIAVYDRLLALHPDNAVAHCSRAILLLRLGRLAEGWKEYEWRWSREGGFKEPRGHFRQPVWQGESARQLGGPLLVIAEQGLGDVIQFARYVPLLAAQGHDVIFETLPDLTVLFREGFDHPRIRVISRIDTPLEIEGNLPFAAWVGVMSLPERFGTTLETIPAAIPYLKVDPSKVERWQELLRPASAGRVRVTGESNSPSPYPLPRGEGQLSVGFVWAGNPKNLNDFARSIPPQMLEPLLAVRGVKFYSLQKGPAAAWEFPAGIVTNLGDRLTDLTEAAAAIESLDLMIVVDTSLAHLAGALGKPVWLMIPTIPDWRWLNRGETTGWYPTMRIFRQTMRGEWGDVIVRVSEALKHLD